ncbi:MAG: glycosyl hydrolase family 28 protein [Sedimentisphaerales bacterium]
MKKTLLVVGLCVISLICTAPVIASTHLYGDFNNDNVVDINDLAHLSALWLVHDCNLTTEGIDLNSDCTVNFYEFSEFAYNWMQDVPLAPTGLSATAGDAKVTLDWNNNTESDLAGYNIYRSTTSGSGYAKLNSSLLSDSNYIDHSVTNGTTYYYVVTAVDTSANESNNSSEVSAMPQLINTPPAAPTGLSATAGNAKVLLDWSNNSESDLAGYNVYRSTTSGSGYAKINTSLRTVSDYNDTGVTNGTTYYYVVTAVNTGASESSYSTQASATPAAPTTASPQNVMVPPMAYDNNTIVLIWSKPTDYSQVTDYRVYKNGVALGLSGRFDSNRAKLYYIVTGLTANTTYNFTVKSLNSSLTEIGTSNICSVTTTPTPTILNIANAPYNASNNGTTKNTTAIQNAINDCPAGGVVLVPAGGTGYLTGAIFLKSNMTLRVDGTLIGAEGSENTDYPKTSWRVPYYSGGVNFMGLVNAYNNYTDANTYPDPHGAGRPYILHDIRICGSGTIEGDIHSTLTNSHIHVGYNESLILDDSHIGDMITIKGVTNFYIGGWGSGTLTLIRPPEHTMFVSYCNGVTLNALNISTYDLHNADGIDLTCSNYSYIFNSAFDTGDDCINMNAGQGLYGQDPNKGGGVPTQNVRVFDCTTNHGHGGFVIGSFTAAWVQDCLVEDCYFINNDTSNGYPIRMKTGSNNGGGGRRNTFRDIRINGCSQQAIHLYSNYDASGYGNGGPGQFSGNTFKNITVTSNAKETIYVSGLSGTPHTNNTFYNINGPNKGAYLDYCTNSTFNYCTVSTSSGWTFTSGTCSGLSGTNNTPQPTWP